MPRFPEFNFYPMKAALARARRRFASNSTPPPPPLQPMRSITLAVLLIALVAALAGISISLVAAQATTDYDDLYGDGVESQTQPRERRRPRVRRYCHSPKSAYLRRNRRQHHSLLGRYPPWTRPRHRLHGCGYGVQLHLRAAPRWDGGLLGGKRERPSRRPVDANDNPITFSMLDSSQSFVCGLQDAQNSQTAA